MGTHMDWKPPFVGNQGGSWVYLVGLCWFMPFFLILSRIFWENFADSPEFIHPGHTERWPTL